MSDNRASMSEDGMATARILEQMESLNGWLEKINIGLCRLMSGLRQPDLWRIFTIVYKDSQQAEN